MLTITWDMAALTRAVDAWAQRAADAVPDATRRALGGWVAATWEASGQGLPLPGMTRRVRVRPFTAQVDPTADGVRVHIPVDLAAHVEGGTPAWDMKPGLTHGPKSRVGRSGARYNIIPFRHRAETVPDAVLWALVQGLRHQGTEGARTSLNAPWAGLRHPEQGHTWRTGLYSGMRLARGGLTTWRTVSERSPAAAWWYPARPGTPWAEPVWQWVADAVTAAWLAAWEEQVFRHD